LSDHVVGIPSAAQRFLSQLPRPFEGVQSKASKWKKLSGSAAATVSNSKGHVQHGLHFVKFKARKLAANTRKSLGSIQAAPRRMTKKTRQRVERSLRISFEEDDEEETSPSLPAEQMTEKAQRWCQYAEKVTETVQESIVPAQMTEKVERGLEYVKEQARATSTTISTQVSQKAQIASANFTDLAHLAISTQVSQTAQKGFALARHLGRKGGA